MNTLLLLLGAGAAFWYFTRTPSSTTPAATTPVYVPPGGGAVTPVPPGSGTPVPATNPPTPPAPVDAGQIVNVSGPTGVGPGEHFDMLVTLRNVGNTRWAPPGGQWTDRASGLPETSQYVAFAQRVTGTVSGEFLGQQDPRRDWGLGGFPAWVPHTLDPGESVTIPLGAIAPDVPGAYTLAVDVWNQETMQEISPVLVTSITVFSDVPPRQAIVPPPPGLWL
jgi:hypothetical protein